MPASTRLVMRQRLMTHSSAIRSAIEAWLMENRPRQVYFTCKDINSICNISRKGAASGLRQKAPPPLELALRGGGSLLPGATTAGGYYIRRMEPKIFGSHDERTLAQMERCMRVGSVAGGVLCADGHLGL